MGNPFVHAELGTSDVKKARDFYGKLFDWKFDEMDAPNGMKYTTIGVGEGTGGGMMESKPVGGGGSAWMPYVLVEDIQASTKKARSLGAEVYRDVTEVPNMGWFSIVKDPTGAAIGLWQTRM